MLVRLGFVSRGYTRFLLIVHSARPIHLSLPETSGHAQRVRAVVTGKPADKLTGDGSLC